MSFMVRAPFRFLTTDKAQVGAPASWEHVLPARERFMPARHPRHGTQPRQRVALRGGEIVQSIFRECARGLEARAPGRSTVPEFRRTEPEPCTYSGSGLRGGEVRTAAHASPSLRFGWAAMEPVTLPRRRSPSHPSPAGTKRGRSLRPTRNPRTRPRAGRPRRVRSRRDGYRCPACLRAARARSPPFPGNGGGRPEVRFPAGREPGRALPGHRPASGSVLPRPTGAVFGTMKAIYPNIYKLY